MRQTELPLPERQTALALLAACCHDLESAGPAGFGRGAGLLAEPPTTDPWLVAIGLTIMSFVVARVYHDFPSLEEKRWSKFEAFLDPSAYPCGQIILPPASHFTAE